jgi:uncharacterized membrane protein YdfJ with MMPL/SSD domain
MGAARESPWTTIGTVVASVGGSLSVGYLLYVLQADGKESIWDWPGLLALALIVVGLVAVILSKRRERAVPAEAGQSQRSGDNSKNQQAGRDINITNEK